MSHNMAAPTHLDGASLKAEALLHNGGELADAAALLAEDALRARGEDDNLSALGGDADVDARVAVRGRGTRAVAWAW